MQRSVGSVGVEALFRLPWAFGFDNYCGVSCLRREGLILRSSAGARERP
jgi:hypothetical protein